jgi:hypothetical protein
MLGGEVIGFVDNSTDSLARKTITIGEGVNIFA